jgi:hypothetical protein
VTSDASGEWREWPKRQFTLNTRPSPLCRPPLAEEAAQQCGAFVGANAGEHLGSVIETRVTEQVAHGSGHSCFLVPSTEHDARDAGEHDRARAHRAGLERHVQRALTEPPFAE